MPKGKEKNKKEEMDELKKESEKLSEKLIEKLKAEHERVLDELEDTEKDQIDVLNKKFEALMADLEDSFEQLEEDYSNLSRFNELLNGQKLERQQLKNLNQELVDLLKDPATGLNASLKESSDVIDKRLESSSSDLVDAINALNSGSHEDFRKGSRNANILGAMSIIMAALAGAVAVAAYLKDDSKEDTGGEEPAGEESKLSVLYGVIREMLARQSLPSADFWNKFADAVKDGVNSADQVSALQLTVMLSSEEGGVLTFVWADPADKTNVINTLDTEFDATKNLEAVYRKAATIQYEDKDIPVGVMAKLLLPVVVLATDNS